jgi:hypothetical protein
LIPEGPYKLHIPVAFTGNEELYKLAVRQYHHDLVKRSLLNHTSLTMEILIDELYLEENK